MGRRLPTVNGTYKTTRHTLSGTQPSSTASPFFDKDLAIATYTFFLSILSCAVPVGSFKNRLQTPPRLWFWNVNYVRFLLVRPRRHKHPSLPQCHIHPFILNITTYALRNNNSSSLRGPRTDALARKTSPRNRGIGTSDEVLTSWRDPTYRTKAFLAYCTKTVPCSPIPPDSSHDPACLRDISISLYICVCVPV